jgi:predicted nuclease of predicted toxin-antitoxin system
MTRKQLTEITQISSYGKTYHEFVKYKNENYVIVSVDSDFYYFIANEGSKIMNIPLKTLRATGSFVPTPACHY